MKSDQRDEKRREEENADGDVMVLVRRLVPSALVGEDRVPSSHETEGGREVDELAEPH